MCGLALLLRHCMTTWPVPVIATVGIVGCYINELFPGVKDEWAAAEGDDEELPELATIVGRALRPR